VRVWGGGFQIILQFSYIFYYWRHWMLLRHTRMLPNDSAEAPTNEYL